MLKGRFIKLANSSISCFTKYYIGSYQRYPFNLSLGSHDWGIKMSVLNDLLMQASDWLKPYSLQLSVAFVATLLVIYGDAINKAVRMFVRPYPFLVRIAAFIVLCTLGYGALTVWGSGQINKLMHQLPSALFAPVVVGAFILLGILAERFHKKS